MATVDQPGQAVAIGQQFEFPAGSFIGGQRVVQAPCGLLDGVVFTGGEATRQLALAPAMARVRDLGFEAIEVRPDYVPAHVMMAQLSLESEDYPAAEEHLREKGHEVKIAPNEERAPSGCLTRAT